MDIAIAMNIAIALDSNNLEYGNFLIARLSVRTTSALLAPAAAIPPLLAASASPDAAAATGPGTGRTARSGSRTPRSGRSER